MKSISTKSNWPQLGDNGYEVEWCSEIPLIPGTQDGDLTNAKFHREVFRTKAQAMNRARAVYPLDAFGEVHINQVTRELNAIKEPVWKLEENARKDYYHGNNHS